MGTRRGFRRFYDDFMRDFPDFRLLLQYFPLNPKDRCEMYRYSLKQQYLREILHLFYLLDLRYMVLSYLVFVLLLKLNYLHVDNQYQLEV